MKTNDCEVMMVAELETQDAIEFLTVCKRSGKSVSEMMTDLIKNFLEKGDITK